MTSGEVAAWQEANDAYLTAGVEWLRLLLMRHAPAPEYHPVQTPAAGAAAAPQAAQPKPWWAFVRSENAAPLPPPQLALPPASTEVTPEQIAEASKKMQRAEEHQPPPALLLLGHRLGLTKFERDVLLLCIAMELDTRIAALCARAQDDAARPAPTFALAFALFEHPSWDALSPARPLRFWQLVTMSQSGAQPLTSSALRADERIVNYVKGLSHIDERLAPYAAPIEEDGEEDLPPSQALKVAEVLRALERDQPHFRPVQLLGRDSASKQLVARAAAARLGLTLYRVAADMLPSQASELETLARLWHRETLLLPLALYIDAFDVDRGSEAHATPLKRFLAREAGVVFVNARESWPVARGSISVDVEKPTPAEQRELWLTLLGEDETETADVLTGQFHLSAAAIRRIATDALDDDEATPLEQRVWAHATRHTRMHIDALAQRIDVKAQWDQLVLPEGQKALLEQIAAHVAGRAQVYDRWGFRGRMNRGLGISALFAGPSGTGKTMAAEVIANQLDQPLHRIDLSSVVSKWVGETEKNLERLFQAADDSNGILFFDEADALFGKRTEVQHSQDRFANMEINFLLQRLESYRGLVILATNMKDALDTAFLRRLRFIVSFPFPGPAERRRIWENVFPDETPRGELDLDRLSRIALTGGSIHNIALASAFLAAGRNEPVTMDTVLEATAAELRKLDKPVSETEFPTRRAKDLRIV